MLSLREELHLSGLTNWMFQNTKSYIAHAHCCDSVRVVTVTALGIDCIMLWWSMGYCL